MLAVSFYQLYRLRNARLLLINIGVLGGLVILCFIAYQHPGKQKSTQLQASVLQSEYGYPDYQNNLPIQDYSEDKKDLIVLPEYSLVFEEDNILFANALVNDRLNKTGISVDVDEGTKEKWYGTLGIKDRQGALLNSQTKELLIPTGEYLPFILTTFYTYTGQSEILDTFNKNRQVYKGESPQVFRSDKFIIGPVACSGILGRNIYRGITNQGAEVLTNSASLVDFNFSKSYLRQSLQMARFHSIANSRPFIQASLGAPAFAMDHQGSYIFEPDRMGTKFIDFTFSTNNSKTLYTKLGETVLYTSLLFVVVVVLRKLINQQLRK